jgi:hypothetical protein
MREADMRRNSNSQWDIGDSCHLTWLKNLQSIHWLPWWDQDMLVRFGPKVMQVEETHIIGGRQLVVHGWLRLSDTHPWETSILPIADSEGTLWGTTCHGDYFDLDDDMSDLAPEGAAPNMVSLFRSVPTSSRYAVHDMSEVLLVREANRISNGGKGGLLFARMKEINCAENLEKRGFIPDDLARILSLCPNLEKLEVKLIPGEDQRNLERSLTDLTPKLRWIYLDAVELACLPHLTHCEYVELIISGDLQPKLPPDDRSSSKTRRHKGVSQIETLIIDFDVTPLYIDPAQLANFTVSWASKDAEITVQAVHVYVDEDTPASKWIRKVNSAIAVLQKRSPKVPSDGSSPAISAVVDR